MSADAIIDDVNDSEDLENNEADIDAVSKTSGQSETSTIISDTQSTGQVTLNL